MALASSQSCEISVTVRFDIIGWDAAQSDVNEAKTRMLEDYVVGAVRSGFDCIDISEDLFDFEGGLFEHVDVDRVDQVDGSVVVSVIAIAAGSRSRFSSGATEVAVPGKLSA